MERVVERDNLIRALKQVERNGGSPGIDGMTVEALAPYLKHHWSRLKEALLGGAYIPQPVKRVEIPKPGGGVRKLGIPTVVDRFIQQAILQVLQPESHLRRIVDAQLRHNWSPQQIPGWLKSTHPEDEAFWVSHETIYRTLFVQTRGALKKELIEHLRLHHPIRRSRHATAKADARGRIPDTVSISERPASVGKTERSPATGKGIYYADRRTVTSSRWSSGTAAT